MVILGIDPGQVRLGVAEIKVYKNGKLNLGHTGVVYHPRSDKLKFNEYLNEGIYQLAESFPDILHIVRPDFIVAEIVPVGRLGSNTELNVAAITTCKTIAWQWGIDWFDISASKVKKLVTDDAKASKSLVKKTVIGQFPQLEENNAILKENQKKEGIKPEGFPQDLFDAVAIAWAGAIEYGTNKTEEE